MATLADRLLNRQPRPLSIPDSSELRERRLANYAKADLNAFIAHLRTDGVGRYALWETVYRDFYAKRFINTADVLGGQQDPVASPTTVDEMQSQMKERFGGRVRVTKEWLAIGTKVPLGQHNGKFFIEATPGKLLPLQAAIVDTANTLDVSLDTKVHMAKQALLDNRSDALLVYASSNQQVATFNLLREIYQQHQIRPLSQRPRFSAPLFPGISFGEETGVAGHNFGRVRSEILAVVALEVSRGKVSMEDTEGMADLFRNSCDRYNVDGDNPAFFNHSNWTSLQEHVAQFQR